MVSDLNLKNSESVLLVKEYAKRYRLKNVSEVKNQLNVHTENIREALESQKYQGGTASAIRRKKVKELEMLRKLKRILARHPVEEEKVNGVVYSGLHDFDSLEVADIKSIISKSYLRLKRVLDKSELYVDVKKQKILGLRHKYSFHFKLESPDIIFTSKESGWDFTRTLHKGLDNLEVQVEKKFRERKKKKKFF